MSTTYCVCLTTSPITLDIARRVHSARNAHRLLTVSSMCMLQILLLRLRSKTEGLRASHDVVDGVDAHAVVAPVAAGVLATPALRDELTACMHVDRCPACSTGESGHSVREWATEILVFEDAMSGELWTGGRHRRDRWPTFPEISR